MYGAIIVSPDTPSADFGVIFIHNEGYSTGCGHAVIALTKAFIETGLIKKLSLLQNLVWMSLQVSFGPLQN